MPKIIVPLVALLVLAAGSGGAFIASRGAPPRNFVRASLVDLPPAPQPAAVIVDLPQDAPVAAVAPVPPTATAMAATPGLPEVEVESRPAHVVPEDDPMPPVPHVSLFDRNGRAIHAKGEATAPKSGAITTAALNAAAAQGLGGGAPQARNGPIAGAAEASGMGLSVKGMQVRLFGVRPPDDRDRCAVKDGAAPEACAEVAHAALAARLQAQHNVTCTMPPGQRGEPGFVCRDGQGTDLAGFLVAEGYALADPAQSYEYFGAEGVARSFQRGLWHYR